MESHVLRSAWDDAKSIGRQDIDSQIADVERRLAQLDQGGFGLVGNRDESRNRLREELDMLRERKKAMEDDARTAGERARAEQAAQNAIDRIDARSRAALTNQQKRAKELEQYKKDLQAIREVNPNDDRLQKATVDREIANINAKYKDQKGSAGWWTYARPTPRRTAWPRSPRPTVMRKRNWRRPNAQA